MDPMMIAALLQAAGDNPEVQQQVLALAGGRFRKVGKKFVKSKPGGRFRTATPPNGTGLRKGGLSSAGAKVANCINCGKKGHRTADCLEGRKEASHRPCFKCGKPGHIAAKCIEPNTNVVTRAPTGAKPTFSGIATTEDATPMRPQPMQRTIATAMTYRDLRAAGVNPVSTLDEEPTILCLTDGGGGGGEQVRSVW